jgi:hypothetical protein
MTGRDSVAHRMRRHRQTNLLAGRHHRELHAGLRRRFPMVSYYIEGGLSLAMKDQERQTPRTMRTGRD